MRMIQTKMISVFTIFLLGLLYSPMVNAGCSEGKSIGWFKDVKSGQIENLGIGKVVECANIHGGFAGFKTESFYVGHGTCHTDCEKGIQSGVSYVKVGEKSMTGKITFGENATCVQQKGSYRKYCWSE
jgi:hypothetical protein